MEASIERADNLQAIAVVTCRDGKQTDYGITLLSRREPISFVLSSVVPITASVVVLIQAKTLRMQGADKCMNKYFTSH